MPHAIVTGGAGFIGSHVVSRLLADGWCVTAIDNFDPFYSESIKKRNIGFHLTRPGYRLIRADIRQRDEFRYAIPEPVDVIVHLAAKAGVRPSIEDPIAYQQTNVQGTQNLLEFARERGVRQFVFASSSSVYGVNPRVPWSEEDHVLLPISPYASTKVSGELLGHTYSYLYGIRFIGLRFFTVYGPGQRPDLAIHKFARLMRDGSPIPIFGDGSTRRDYTFIADIVSGVRAAIDYKASAYEIINLGNNNTVTLLEMVQYLQQALGWRSEVQFHPDQPGDVPQTWANVDKAARLLNYSPATTFATGIRAFAEWYKSANNDNQRAQAEQQQKSDAASARL
jgi:UDP-glucuronate 4-epimerase